MRTITLAFVLIAATSLLAQSSSTYKITHTYTLGGDGSWDYVVPDPPNHRLFIARQNRVMVVDEDTGKLLGEVTGIQGAHGTAMAARYRARIRHLGQRPVRGHVRSEDLQGAGPIPAAEDADAIVYDGASNRVFTLNGDAHSSTVIDPRAGNADHEHSAWRQTGIRRVRRRWQSVRQSHRHERGR